MEAHVHSQPGISSTFRRSKLLHECQYNEIVEKFQSAYNEVVLIYLSAAFDTIDHDNIFCIIEKYVYICENSLKIIHVCPFF